MGALVLIAADSVAQSYRDCPLCPQMVVIKPGEVTIDDAAAPGGKRRIAVKYDFAIGKYEVTRGQFSEFIAVTAHKAGPCLHRKDGRWQRNPNRHWTRPGFRQRDDEPVVCVSSADAKAYVAWVSKRTGQHYRLPTETEWLYATHANRSKSPYASIYGRHVNKCELGNAADLTLKAIYTKTVVVNCSDTFRYTAPIGRFKANPLGLHDLLGNVSEWVMQCTRHGQCNGKTVRGGSWLTRAGTARLAYQHRSTVKERFSDVGFRVVKSIKKKK
ncbi:MAG: hypothetical protein CMM48_00695 [Rhodospirillaceae bacterium]|nr:hypothetical protein [Rhodospirillaceae bacterium]